MNKTIKEIGRKIISGDVKIQPYIKGKETPCNYCEYSSICKFDKMLDENTYRVINRLSRDLVWQVLENVKEED